MKQPPDSPCWIFDASPPSGHRRGGDPSEYAFPPTLDAFVREALQNANDQSLPTGLTRAEVHFDLEDLTGRELQKFLAALDWKTLETHLQGAAAVKSISKFRRFGETFEEPDRLTLLRVEDRYTTGLFGDEDSGESNFRALCRDSLLSHKDEGSGGSYGLGKSVYWAFSEWSTVLFHSRLQVDGRHRLIGRVELPSHVAGKAAFMGPGWFGRAERVKAGERAISLWNDQARDLAKRLHLTRPDKITGTTILIVGFLDPTDDDPQDLATLRRRIRESAARFFWPAMNYPRPLRIFVDGEQVLESDEVAAFAATWRRREQVDARLVKPGDVVRVQIPLEVPRHRSEKTPPTNAVCDLLVRLGEPEAPTDASRDSQLAVFRGPGMVVNYRVTHPGSNLPRFHAILACGDGRAPEQSTPTDHSVEAFLRKCEPPGHDEWTATSRLRMEYVKGGRLALTQLFDAVRKAIQELLAPPTQDAHRGPELLQRRFPLGNVGDPTPETSPTPFHFRNLHAEFTDRRWRFRGVVEPVTPGHAWTATITLKMLGDDGSDAGHLKISEFTLADARGSKYELVDDGAVQISAKRNVDTLRFHGLSEPLPGRDQLCELGLEIFGELHTKGGV